MKRFIQLLCLVLLLSLLCASCAPAVETTDDTGATESEESMPHRKAFEEFEEALKSKYSTLYGKYASLQNGIEDAYDNTYRTMAAAAVDPSGGISGSDLVLSSFSDIIGMTSTGRTKLLEYSSKVFWLLAFVQVCLTFGVEFLEHGLELQAWAAALIRTTLTTGFFWYVCTQGPGLLGSLVTYFIDAGKEVAGVDSVSAPKDFFRLGIDLYLYISSACYALAEDIKGTGTGAQLATAFAAVPALTVAGSFIMISANWLITVIESYLTVTMSMLLLGLGGCRFTRQAVEHVMWTVVQIGLKVVTLMFLMSAATESVLVYVGAFSKYSGFKLFAPLVAIAAAAAIFAQMCYRLPGFVASLAGRGSNGGTPDSGGMILSAWAMAKGAGSFAASPLGLGLTDAASRTASSVRPQNTDFKPHMAGDMMRNLDANLESMRSSPFGKWKTAGRTPPQYSGPDKPGQASPESAVTAGLTAQGLSMFAKTKLGRMAIKTLTGTLKEK